MNPQPLVTLPCKLPKSQLEWFIMESKEATSNYFQLIQTKIFRAFNNIYDEAVEHRVQLADQMIGNATGVEDEDDSHIHTTAAEFAAEYYFWLKRTGEGTVNLVGAALFHLTEQQLGTLIKELRPIRTHGDFQFEKIKKILKNDQFKIDVTKWSSWTKMRELNLVANVIKHSAGRSERELRRMRPDYFPSREIGGVSLEPGPLNPLIGEGFRIGEADLQAYFDAILLFWDELLAALNPYFGLSDSAA